ncbi:MAG TPA: hypothetical protein VKB02_11755 [Pyrinomonadaceae bacterium]|nr:hypothetical protein [Pyrinomonadaceae bacterium]
MILIIVLSLILQTTPANHAKLTGRWHVTFSLQGDAKKNLIFEPQAKGDATFKLLDTGADNKPVPDLAPAAWSELSNNRVSFTGEIELQIGDCCREIGTLIFKGRRQSSTSITGKIIFVTSIDEEESAYQFRSHVGTFTATLVN